jgi:hypothetical protein
MSRLSRVRVLALTALLAAAGCQDYNFNPVGHCLIQPGSERVTLSNMTTADVLFVVDDSGSMGGEQQKLAANFSAFINNLDATNATRRANALTPFDFHVAITTTSVFYNPVSTATCRDDCPGGDGASVCCNSAGTAPELTVQKCAGPADATCSAGSCRLDCNRLLGEYVCCDGTSKVPARTQPIPCAHVGEACGDLQTHYFWTAGACTPGIATNGSPYPQGSFVGAGSNPRVIHFDKSLYPEAPGGTPTNAQGFTADQLKTFFSQNVVAGTCGSNQEAAFQAGKLAVSKALAGSQLDTYDAAGAPGSFPAGWPHADSKLVLVFVGDEDDCSSPQDANGGVVLSGNPGSDSCVNDAVLPVDQQRLYSVASMVDYFLGLDRPLGAAFIASAKSGTSDTCVDETCSPAICCDTACTGNAAVCTSTTCGGQAKGTRLLEAAGQLRAAGADVIAGSICDPNFGTILDRIAELAKPPSGLLLPSQPAAEQVCVLRIARADGKTRKTCFGPAPAGLTTAEAEAASYDWWFTASREQVTDAQKAPTGASRYVYINQETENCKADTGETYSADYLGRLPAGGCSGASAEEADASCVANLGGRSGDWTCFAGVDDAGACVPPTGAVVGTCICGARAASCPSG